MSLLLCFSFLSLKKKKQELVMIPLEWFGWATICGNSLAKFANLIWKSSIYYEIITSESSRTRLAKSTIILFSTTISYLKRHQLSKYLESSWAPVHELNGSLGLDCSNGCIHVLWYHISTKQQTASHVFAMAWVTFYQLISWLKASIGDFSNCKLFMVGFLGRDDRSISSQWEMNPWIRHQVGLQ